MRLHHFNLVTGSLYRTPLRLTEGLDDQGDNRKSDDPATRKHSWDLGYQHAHRGKDAEPDNQFVKDRQSYTDGYKTGQRVIAGGRREQDIEPAMRLSLDDVPKTVQQVNAVIAAAGGRALLIGGSVRDKLMGKTPKDFDIEVYGLGPDQLAAELGKIGQVDAVGKAFGVLKIKIGTDDFDVSVPRRESKSGVGHKGFIPEPDPTMSISEAARRRDFTMNTVAMDPVTGDVFDPYGGVEDIKNKTLRATDPTAFVEDPLRILRGAQFAARLGFSVHPDTMKLMQQASPELVHLPNERVGGEWRKLLMKSSKPSLGMEVMKQAGVLKALHPELEAMEATPQEPEFHPEGNVWIHTKMVVDRAAEISKDMTPEQQEVIRYAALMHDIAKPYTTITAPDGRVRSPGHEEAGGKLVTKMFQQQFDVSKDLAAKVEKIVNEHLKPQIFYMDREKVTDSGIRRLAKRLAPASIEELVHSAHADHTGRGVNGPQSFPAGEWLAKRAEELQVNKEPMKPILMGRHLVALGIQQGKAMGQILNQVAEMQMDGRVTSLEGAMQAAREIIAKGPQPAAPKPKQESANLLTTTGGLYRTPLKLNDGLPS